MPSLQDGLKVKKMPTSYYYFLEEQDKIEALLWLYKNAKFFNMENESELIKEEIKKKKQAIIDQRMDTFR